VTRDPRRATCTRSTVLTRRCARRPVPALYATFCMLRLYQAVVAADPAVRSSVYRGQVGSGFLLGRSCRRTTCQCHGETRTRSNKAALLVGTSVVSSDLNRATLEYSKRHSSANHNRRGRPRQSAGLLSNSTLSRQAASATVGCQSRVGFLKVLCGFCRKGSASRAGRSPHGLGAPDVPR
jgi:hypothetical protein